MKLTGKVFNIEKYHIHDGGGIRTVVFLMGCNLVCPWCSNPESQTFESKVVTYDNLCQHCNYCVRICPEGAISVVGHHFKIDYAKCNQCGLCKDMCPRSARQIYGYEITVDEVMKEILKDAAFYARSGGGVTISGGEPLLQPEFVHALIAACRKEYISTAIETAGFIPTDILLKTVAGADEVLLDIKTLDPLQVQTLFKEHVDGNAMIGLLTANVRALAEISVDLILRCPVIPGFNNSEKHIGKVIELAIANRLKRIDLLPFHQFGKHKYKALQRPYKYLECPPLNESEIQNLKQQIESAGLICLIGG